MGALMELMTLGNYIYVEKNNSIYRDKPIEKFEIGGVIIDRFNGSCMKADSLYDIEAKSIVSNYGKTVIIPLRLSMCLRENTYIPIISLAFHQVKIFVKLSTFFRNKIKLLTEYIVLDTSERRLFAQTTHDYTVFPRDFIVEQSLGRGDKNKKSQCIAPCEWVVNKGCQSPVPLGKLRPPLGKLRPPSAI